MIKMNNVLLCQLSILFCNIWSLILPCVEKLWNWAGTVLATESKIRNKKMCKLGLVCSIKGFKWNLLEYMFQAMRECMSEYSAYTIPCYTRLFYPCTVQVAFEERGDFSYSPQILSLTDVWIWKKLMEFFMSLKQQVQEVQQPALFISHFW